MFREGVRRVVLSQFMLHEVRHHPDREAGHRDPGPRMPRAHTLADVYKCLHQGEFGPGHSIEDETRFFERLAEEIHAVPAVADEPILESIAPDDSIFRLNLRPFKAAVAEDDVDEACRVLTEVCVQSAGMREGTADRFLEKLRAFRDVNDEEGFLVDGTRFAFPVELVVSFLRDMLAFVRASRSVPVLGHSIGYHDLNAPSYRVVEEIVLKHSALTSLLG